MPQHDLVEGTVIGSDLGDWTVIETPGHAPSHVCLHQPEHRLLISGDHLLGRIALYFDYGWTPDPVGEFLASLDKVEALDARLALSGHGRPFTDVHGHVEGNRRLVAERLDAVRAALAEGPGTPYELAPRVYGEDWTPERRTWLMTKMLCWLRHLEVLGEASPDGRVPGDLEAAGGGLELPAMRIDEHLADGGPCFSFEFFPPKTDQGERNLGRALAELSRLDPAFVSVTYGAGGSTEQKAKTVDIVSHIKADYGLEAMAHFTCVGATTDDLRATLDHMRKSGIQNVLALRGDPPAGQEEWTATEGGLSYSRELIELIRAEYDFAIGAACFPETHIHAYSPASDLRYCKEKVDAGARFLITQLFFDNAVYYDFVARARDIGIDVPIIPGIMPVTDLGQLKRFTSMCGATIPDALLGELELRADSPEAVAELGVAYATLQCADLLANGAPGIHFYTLNKSHSTRAILGALRAMAPWRQRVAA